MLLTLLLMTTWLTSDLDAVRFKQELREAGFASELPTTVPADDPELQARWQRARARYEQLPPAYSDSLWKDDSAPPDWDVAQHGAWSEQPYWNPGEDPPLAMRAYYAQFPDLDAQLDRILTLLDGTVPPDPYAVDPPSPDYTFILDVFQLCYERTVFAEDDQALRHALAHSYRLNSKEQAPTTLIGVLLQCSMLQSFDSVVIQRARAGQLPLTPLLASERARRQRHLTAHISPCLHNFLLEEVSRTSQLTGISILVYNLFLRSLASNILSDFSDDEFTHLTETFFQPISFDDWWQWRQLRIHDWRFQLNCVQWAKQQPLRYRHAPRPPMDLPDFRLSLSSVMERLLQTLAHTDISAAITVRCLRGGQLPDSWPEDPFAPPGTPLRQLRDADGRLLAVYSIGMDGVDDGGNDADDIVITIRSAETSAGEAP